MMMKDVGWRQVLEAEFDKDYYKEMWSFLAEAYDTENIYPPKDDVFNAFELTHYEDVKVVILGQDPYHGSGQAHGLSFSVKEGVKLPPSLKNIYKELMDDVGCPMPEHGCLTKWAKQGVLLLNAFLTVKEKEPSSHSKKGWQFFTDRVIEVLNEREKPVIFVLWGNFAISKEELITNPWHKIIKSPHPSPFSARKGFFGSKPFSTINHMLHDMDETLIDWIIEAENEQLSLDDF